ncbi:enoyl-CoA hydratase-related protein [Nocardioides zeae]|uniref:Enoyl-CoA hydratase-related protein n=1 Tax=Nocardioides imazamoxiresistens TaxID=3231893 RepID=A0ABU3PXZ5_9ACTN|nr:enoyl-CoA hydratase-related protein [Nocardioides zeae]MDT9594113.1 enoyl-CoA hydratase-related protein [Nocardioides zeae]
MDGHDVPASVEVERQDAVAVVHLGRPALDTPTKEALRDALADVGADPAVRAVVLTGRGRAFCVGQDLGEHAAALAADPGSAFATVDAHYSPVVTSLATMPKPVVAAVNGTCVGAGLGLALACDLRVLAAGARLGTAFTAIGLTCDSGLSATLAAEVGVARARELVLLASPFTAEDAVGWGVVAQVVAPGDVLTTATALAHRLAAGPTQAYAASKRLLAAAGHRDLAATLTAEAAEQAALGLTQDHRGAVDAFLAKERPTFSGR